MGSLVEAPGGGWVAHWTDRDGMPNEETVRTEAQAVGRIVRRAAAPTTFHGLRHAYISALVAEGVDPSAVASAAGHASAAFTLSRYTHRTAGAADRLRAAGNQVAPNMGQEDLG
ncbi:tyrosine-type recombinase/integrase [Luteipulveratus halotolerans]|uniref:tyrosine-type recombinase/integrase n=1 Tax=Luteipulveratus halotolerans TaxID=1631356 RepID=UPI000682DAE7|nr:tyrosine-type recombinase/integrase [Luteipulveratus halotolerans]